MGRQTDRRDIDTYFGTREKELGIIRERERKTDRQRQRGKRKGEKEYTYR
jgi:hypothetical protein